jgi:CubicO group peptidase (beta-lactamase class C family)
MKFARLKIRFFPLVALLAVLIAAAPAALGQVLPKADPEQVGLSPERLKRIDALINQHIKEKKIAGAVSLVARRGKVAHLGVYGMQDAEAAKPMQADTIFRSASMTKPITSTAVMMLYEEGRFLLSDPVSKFIPEFKDMTVLPPESSADQTPAAAARPVTIRHLLTHTSGLTYQWNKRLGHKY